MGRFEVVFAYHYCERSELTRLLGVYPVEITCSCHVSYNASFNAYSNAYLNLIFDIYIHLDETKLNCLQG
jgi:hypothetical protein